VNGQLALLGEWLRRVDRIARGVWQTQGEPITPDFVRDVLVLEAMTLIAARDGVIKSNVELVAMRTRLKNSHNALRHLAMKMRKLKGEVANRYEIEARELQYQKTPAAQNSTNSKPDPGRLPAKEQRSETQALSLKLERGKRCAQIVDEMKRFKYLRLDSARTVAEIQTDCSGFLFWKLRENLSPEDRDLFDHPNRWESVVNYAYLLLGKEYTKSWTTIRDWVKAWKRSQQPRK
jgi:hypothetical protein